MEIGDTWYVVTGGFFGPVTHPTLKEAEDDYSKIKDNSWTHNPHIIEHKVIK